VGFFDVLAGFGSGLKDIITGPIGQAGFQFLLTRQQRKDEVKFAKELAKSGIAPQFSGLAAPGFGFPLGPPPVVSTRIPSFVGGGGPLLLGPGPTVPAVGGRMAVGRAPFVSPIPTTMARADGFAFPALAEALGLGGNGAAAGSLVDCPSAFAPTGGSGMRAKRTLIMVSPAGNLVFYRNMGQPLLFSGDLAASKRVARVARRAHRARPHHHHHRPVRRRSSHA